MADLIFYTNPSVARADHPLDARGGRRSPTTPKSLDYATTMKSERYLAINPMGKVPAIEHNGQVVTEVRGDLRLSRRRLPRGRPGAARGRKAPIITAGCSSPRARSKRR